MDQTELNVLQSRFEAGDELAYKELLEQCGHYCIRKLVAETNCLEEDAEDILMDSVLIFRDNLLSGKITYLTNLRSYVFGICYNNWLKHRRTRQRFDRIHMLVADDLYEPETSVEAQLIKGEDMKIQQKIHTNRVYVSQQALLELGEKCRKIITFFYIDEKSMTEIAQLMGYANSDVAKNLKSRCYLRWIQVAQQKMELLNEK